MADANGGAETGTSTCAFCEADVADAPPRERAHATGLWRVTAHRSALPGWMLLMPQRHVESLAALTPTEAAELGQLLREASVVHVDEFGAQKTYVMQFAEGVKHVHFSLAPRMADLPTERRGAKVSAYNAEDEPLSDAERDQLARRIGLAWPAPHPNGDEQS